VIVPQFPVTVRVPRLANVLPRLPHPDTEQLMAEVGHWAHHDPWLRSAYGDVQTIDANLDGVRLAALAVPHAGHALALMACKNMVYFISIENSLVDKGGLGGSVFATRSVFGRFMADVLGFGDQSTPLHDDFAWLRGRLSPSRWRRMVAYQEDFAHGFTSELETWREAGIHDVQTYLRDRRHSLGVRWQFGYAEEAIVGLDIPDEAFADPDVITLHDTAIDLYTLLNDLVSFRKELAMGDRINLLYFLYESKGHDLDAAVAALCALVDDTEAAFVALRDRILSGPFGTATGMGAYLAEIGHVATSNLWWAAVSQRYEPHGLAWDGTREGSLTLYRDHAEFTPATGA